MIWIGPQSDRPQVRGVLLAVLALAIMAAVSPVFVMPGCTMSMEPFDFGCSHGYITQHITEAPTAMISIIIAALVAVAFALMLGRATLVGRLVPIVADPATDDPLGARLRV